MEKFREVFLIPWICCNEVMYLGCSFVFKGGWGGGVGQPGDLVNARGQQYQP